MSTLEEQVEQDKRYWFPWGTTPLGHTDYIKPVQVLAGQVDARTCNFSESVILPAEEYAEVRKNPRVKVGMWSFASPDEPTQEIIFCHQNPSGAGHALAALQRDNARLREAVKMLVKDFDDLIADSDGVAGLHANDDAALWNELTEGDDNWVRVEQARIALEPRDDT